MKSKIIGVLNIILGAVTAIGPRTFLHVCGGGMKMDDSMGEGAMEMKMACAGVPNASLIVGIVLAVFGLILIAAGSKNLISKVFGLLTIAAGVVIIGIPTFIVGVCEAAHMHCHMVTRPALIIIGAAVILAGLINTILKNGSKESDAE